jgi:hypothetical protein
MIVPPLYETVEGVTLSMMSSYTKLSTSGLTGTISPIPSILILTSKFPGRPPGIPHFISVSVS